MAPTPVIGVLAPYSTGGADLFPEGSVEAHWYQWDGLHVVPYRRFDAAAGTPICTGNSIFDTAVSDWLNVSNAPHNGTIEEICN